MPLVLPMKMRPLARVGCALASSVAGNPKAHLTFNWLTLAGVIPACSAVWKRVFARFWPQPFQSGLAMGLVNLGKGAVHMAAGAGTVSSGRSKDLPVMNSA